MAAITFTLINASRLVVQGSSTVQLTTVTSPRSDSRATGHRHPLSGGFRKHLQRLFWNTQELGIRVRRSKRGGNGPELWSGFAGFSALLTEGEFLLRGNYRTAVLPFPSIIV